MSSFQTNIGSLGISASFRDWFDQYNDSVLGKLNNSLISRPLAGDGITFTSSNDGGYTFALSGSISTNVTFSGNVLFNGPVQFSSAQLSGLIFGITGNYLSAGVTVGKVVRMTNSGGITLAKADSPGNAEVLGIAIDVDSTRTLVAIGGKIFGTTLSNNLIPGGFTSGCVYFVDPVVAGGITRTEPSILGLVSKPILLGVNSNEGIILPYRGQFISGTGGLSGNYVFNSAIIVDVVSQGELENAFGLRPGTIIGTDTNSSTIPNNYSGVVGSNYYFKATNQTPIEKIMGIVTEYVRPYNSTQDSTISLRVNTNGSVINNVTSLNGWGSLNSGVIYLDSNGNPTQTRQPAPVVLVGNVSANNLIVNIDSESTSGPISSISGSEKTENILINGSLNLWQRGRGISSAFGITAGTTPKKEYIADRWIMWGASGERGFTAHRKVFTENQTDVPGYPKYYISLQKNTTNSADMSYLYNIIENPRTVSQKQFTFSFYARSIDATGSFSIHSTQYSSVSGYIDGVTHSTYDTPIANNWNRYTATFVGPTASSAPISYFLVGVGLMENGKTYEFAQFMMEPGSTTSAPKMISPSEDYERAAYFYQRSYDPDEIVATNTIPQNRGVMTDLQTRRFVIKHHMIYGMARTPQVTIFSLKGKTGEISFKDPTSATSNIWYDSSDAVLQTDSGLRSCLSGFGPNYQPSVRSPATSQMISTISATQKDFFFSPLTSYCSFDTIGFHYIADADTTIQ